MIERPQWYSIKFANPALAVAALQLGQEITLDTDAPFRMTGVAIYCFDETGAAVGAARNVAVSIQFTMPDLTWVQKRLFSSTSFLGHDLTLAQFVNPFDGQAVNGAAGQTAPYY